MIWGKGSGSSGATPSDSASEAACPATSTLSDFSALQQAAPTESTENRHVAQRISLSQERGEKAGDRRDHLDRVNMEVTVRTRLIIHRHLPLSRASARKWRSGIDSGPPSLRGCIKQPASWRISLLVDAMG